jgi:riboflavin synthase
MFTGLIADLGEVDAVDTTPDGARLRIRTSLAEDLQLGDSIAVNGVCLTASETSPGAFTAEAMHETLRRSTLGGLRAGDRVNLELALRAADRLGGHVVQGHVDGTGTIAAIAEEGFSRRVTVVPDGDLLRYVVEKGSIAINGISLTVAALGEDRFDVALIPETLERTTLGAAAVGDRVNLEVDVLAKYVERLIATRD